MRRLLVTSTAVVLGLTLLPPGAAVSGAGTPPGTRPFPARIELPDGFQPEGIAIGDGPTAWLGSLADGDVYEVSLRTGRGKVISEGPGTPSVGLKSDRHGRLYIAGGPAGTARVVDTRSGDVLADVALTTGASFVNDVVLTRRAAWFTDSSQPQLYRLTTVRRGGGTPTATTLPLTGEWVQGTGFGANGIATTPTGRDLLVVNSTSGLLYRVDTTTGAATEVDLGDASLTMGDGMLRDGRILYVVRNRANEIAVLRLSRDGLSGRLVRTITAADLDPSTGFDVPTTLARFGSSLYLPNARFGTPPTPTTDYWITKVVARPRTR
jgi:sugar lactone lactonase YvrE